MQLADLHICTDARTAFVHKLGDPVAPRTVGVQFRYWAWQYTTPTGEVWYKPHFRTTAVGMYKACWLAFPYRCPHYLCTQTGRSRGASYRCMMPATRMPVIQRKQNTLMLTAFCYNGCTDVYSSWLKSHTGATCFVHKLGSTVTTRKVDVQFRECARRYTTPSHNSYANGILVQPLFGSVQLADLRFCTFLCECPHNPSTQIGRYRGTSYRRCTVPILCMTIHHPNGRTLTQTVFWYNRWRDLYSLLTYVAVRLPVQPLYKNCEIPWHLVQ